MLQSGGFGGLPLAFLFMQMGQRDESGPIVQDGTVGSLEPIQEVVVIDVILCGGNFHPSEPTEEEVFYALFGQFPQNYKFQ